MIIKCKLSGEDVELPCAAANCPLFGDCAVQYTVESQKKMTNADRIRAMTDEQLAVVIMCPKEIGGAVSCEVDVPCVECCQKWLQQPAEVE